MNTPLGRQAWFCFAVYATVAICGFLLLARRYEYGEPAFMVLAIMFVLRDSIGEAMGLNPVDRTKK